MRKSKKYISFLLAAFLGVQMGFGTYAGETNLEEVVIEQEMPEEEVVLEEEMDPQEVFDGNLLTGTESYVEMEEIPDVLAGAQVLVGDIEPYEPEEVLSLEAPLEEEVLGEEELLEKIKDGEMIALASGVELLAANSSPYTIVQTQMVSVTDRYGMWRKTGYRRIRYVDSEGNTVYSPLYCMNASKDSNGVQGIPDSSLATADAPIKVYETLKNTDLQKILYFGYGGPGDITGKIDPTSADIDWSLWQTRYTFTHYALSYVYAKDLGGISEERMRAAGVFAFIDLCKKQKMPSFNDLTFSVRKSYSDAATTSYSTGRNISTKLTLYQKTDPEVAEKTDFLNGCQMSNVIAINGCEQNYISLTTHSDPQKWQLLYWKSEADYQNKGYGGAIAAPSGKSLKLYGGYRFQIVLAKGRIATWNMNYSMGLRPVQFLIVKGQQNINYPQYNIGNEQDFGAFVYSDVAAQMSLTLIPQPYSQLVIEKTDANGKKLDGAKFALYANETIYSGTNLIYQKDQKIGTVTVANGEHTVGYLYKGSYYLMEVTPPTNYKITNTGKINVNIAAANCATPEKPLTPVRITVENIPDIQVELVLKKVDSFSGEILKDAGFVLDEWNGKSYIESTKYKMVYRDSDQKYHSDSKLVWTKKNQGKFRIREIKAPEGYSGDYVKEFVIGGEFPSYQKILDLGDVKNVKEIVRKLVIKKTDEKNTANLSDAEFTLYEWNEEKQTFSEREKLKWNASAETYESSTLEITELNMGKFKVVETKNPEGYTGEYQETFVLKESDRNGTVYKTVTNKEIEKLTGSVEVKKQDSKTKENLEGAEFVVWEWSVEKKNYQDTLKENRKLVYQEATQTYRVENLRWTEENAGKFLVKETKNPDGYQGTFEKEVELKENQDNHFSFVAYNEAKIRYGKIVVTKRIKEADINWANGNPTFLFVVEGTDTKGIQHKYEDYLVYVAGSKTYQVDKEGYANLSLTFENIPEGSYQIYEKAVARYYLAEMTAVTSNVSIWSSGKIGYGLQPKESFRGTAVLSYTKQKNDLYAAVVFRNEKQRWDKDSHTDVVKNSVWLGQ